jgi:hypothetical protein
MLKQYQKIKELNLRGKYGFDVNMNILKEY